MADLKHVGRVVSNKRKVIVAYRVVPGEPESCIVVTTENLPAEEHDTLINLVESNAGQEANDLAIVMARTHLPDGRIMLNHFHRTGKLIKMPTNQIELTPNRNTTLLLSELNEIVAQNKGISVEDLAVKSFSNEKSAKKVEIPVSESPLSDRDLAEKYMKDADSMIKEAERLRAEASRLLEQSDAEEKVAE